MGRKPPRVSLRQWSSTRGNSVSSCKGKTPHETEAQAITAKMFCERTRNLTLGVYQCPTCEKWHLTSR